MNRRTKVIVTIGPATATERSLRQIKGKGVDFVRVNMSHSNLDDLVAVLELSMQVGLPFILDTEGSQVRTGPVVGGGVSIAENTELRIHSDPIDGDSTRLSLRPASVLEALRVGDLIHIDFDTLALRVADTSTLSQGFVTATAISRGNVGSNKAVVIDPRTQRPFVLPPLSDKDLQAIEIGLRRGVGHIAMSFVRSGADIDEVRRLTRNSMKIIAKVECIDALDHLDEILAKADAILLDRGDLSKEIPIERLPFTQKIVLRRARQYERDVFVATNLLETMVRDRKPTRAEVQDVVNTLIDGAAGLTLAAETAIGKHPLECINVLNTLILHAEQTLDTISGPHPRAGRTLIDEVDEAGYLLDYHSSSALVPPHGGRLVSRVVSDTMSSAALDGIASIQLDRQQRAIVEQIAVGALSPLEGFLGSDDFRSVVDQMRLTDGTVWPVPIVLDVARPVADRLRPGQPVGLTDDRDGLIAVLHLSEVYEVDWEDTADKMYGTATGGAAGANDLRSMQPVLLAGKIDLLNAEASGSQAFELTPKQVRRLFSERGWAKILGFHSPTMSHRAHEFMRLLALAEEDCDGVFVHLVVGGQRQGHLRPELVIKRYETMVKRSHPENKVIFATVPAFPRAPGPRGELLAALHHKNFGCSHFIAGRTSSSESTREAGGAGVVHGVPDVGIKAVRMDEVRYSPKRRRYVRRRPSPSANVSETPAIG